MQTILQSVFNLRNTSYWHPLIWIFAAGILLYKMLQRTEYLGGRQVRRWYWFTAILLVFPYILWAGSRTNFIDTITYINGFRRAPSSLSHLPHPHESRGPADRRRDPGRIAAGTLKLVGTDEEVIYRSFKELLENETEYKRMSNASNPYGDGFACKRIADILCL